MLKPSARRGTLVLAAVAALLVAAFAVVPAAQASTIYACVSTSGNAHVFTKKPKKCKSKKEKLVSWSTTGPAGKNGANGSNGTNGSSGTNGANGAVAGYGAVQSADLNITNASSLTQVPGLTKTLPSGTFVASGNIEIEGSGKNEKETVTGDCEMANTPTSGAPLVQEGKFVSWTNNLVIVIFVVHVAEGEIPFHMAISNPAGVTSTLTISCDEIGRGEEVTLTATHGSFVAVQTSANN
jgi:hypothetical protein